MDNHQSNLLDDDLTNKSFHRRRNLLPKWIKVCCWIFMVLGGFALIGFIFGFFGLNFNISIYGLESDNPLSINGMVLTVIFLLKGISAWALWTEKDWAINVAMADAIIGFVICTFSMFVGVFTDASITFRFELILLVFYLLKLSRIKTDWEIK